MHSESTAARHIPFQPAFCHHCLQQGPQHTRGPVDGSCLRMEPGIAQCTAPFPKEFGIADGRSERTGTCGTSPPRQVYVEEIQHPCYTWWDRPLNSPQAPCACVREIRQECGCVRRWYYPELPLHKFNGSHVPPHLKVRGHNTKVLYVSERQQPQWDNVKLSTYNGHCPRRRVSFQHPEERHGFNSTETSRQSSPSKAHYNGPNSGQVAFFPTEVPPSKLGCSRAHGPMLKVNGAEQETGTSQVGVDLENHSNKRKSQGTVREQIKQVVTELEEVLGGLKQVQLEMKEVVQQIDILTSNIDLTEEDPSPSNGIAQDGRHRSSWTSVVALIHNSNAEQEVSQRNGVQNDTKTRTSCSSITHSPVSVNAIHTDSPPPMRNQVSPSPTQQQLATVEDKDSKVGKQNSEMQRIKNKANGTCLPHRTYKVKPQHHKGQLENHRPPSNKTQRPPPYPQNGQVKMRTPPYPGKHKTLSSTIV
ncbi:uncharacterized protein LOC127441441 [Myxocyprinus asiaticus]|uniref:uncharacterized protein LOC127441441 n=1 Tax=Myxocyprinus asiaticus TaxID=70543 RepID=UPI002221E883|nr:uncharacterized protein LOC127441441 [Myxocyprinus asiaticus]XP_051554846.1 uncharacterized protein LOC127441441 [Myxocyprinus asiaticus]